MLEIGRSLAAQGRVSPVVAVRLCGGLGNQLFQYAAGRSLAHRSRARLVLDATVFTLPQERRRFALAPFAIDATVMYDGYAHPPPTSVVTLPPPRWGSGRAGRLADRIIVRLGGRPGTIAGAVTRAVAGMRSLLGGPPAMRVFAEKRFDYDAAFAGLRPPTYLEGYWQSYRYFVDVGDVVRRELTLPYAPNAANSRWLARIAGANAVCVHVRRGDYLAADHFALHGVCSVDYYTRAMALVAERVENPQFFVFADDLPWCRQHIGGPNVQFVDANPLDAAQDEMKLMAACRHHIIANSSLSWWGAWLARHDGQLVIGPDPWFSATKETPDLFPPTWLALPRG